MDSTYLALLYTYRCSVQLVNDPNEILNLSSHPYVAIEEKNDYTTPLMDFEHPETCVYITGNSKYRWPSGWIDVQHRVHIPVPDIGHPLYGCQAAAITLNDRYMKNV